MIRDDRTRALAAEARVAELEAELACWREQHLAERDQAIASAALYGLHARIRPFLPRALRRRAAAVARLLIALLEASPAVLSAERLLRVVGLRDPEAYVGTKTVDVAICHARKALRAGGLDERVIRNVLGKGWVILPESAPRVREWLGLPEAQP